MDGSPPSSPAPQSAFQRAFNRSNFSISNLLTIWSQHICNVHGKRHMIIISISHLILSRYLNQIFIIISLRVELCDWWECRGWRYCQHHHYQHHLLPLSQKSSRTSSTSSSPSYWSSSWSPGMGSSADSWESGSEPEVGNRIPVTRITKITMMKTKMKAKMMTRMMMMITVTLIVGLSPSLTSFWIISSQISSSFLKFCPKFSISGWAGRLEQLKPQLVRE